jgi:hypothetical protein
VFVDRDWVFFLEGFLFLICSLVLFPVALTPIRPATAGPFDQCDQVEEELWARPI